MLLLYRNIIDFILILYPATLITFFINLILVCRFFWIQCGQPHHLWILRVLLLTSVLHVCSWVIPTSTSLFFRCACQSWCLNRVSVKLWNNLCKIKIVTWIFHRTIDLLLPFFVCVHKNIQVSISPWGSFHNCFLGICLLRLSFQFIIMRLSSGLSITFQSLKLLSQCRPHSQYHCLLSSEFWELYCSFQGTTLGSALHAHFTFE